MQKNSQQEGNPPEPKAGGKLTIRRKGGILPTVCLVVLLLLAVLLGWLMLVGLPGFVLRYIEGKAAEQGYYVHVERARLAPAGGLAVKVDGLQLFTRQEDTRPLASVENAFVEMRWGGIFSGDYTPKRASVTGVKVEIPVSDRPGAYLTATSQGLSMQTNDEELRINEGELLVQGIAVHISGAIQKPKKEEKKEKSDDSESTSKSEPFDLAKQLAEIQPYVDRAYHTIQQQHWQTGEAPVIDVEPKFQNGGQIYQVRLNLPRMDVEPYHFRNGDARLTYREDGTLVVEKLKVHTIAPDSIVEAKGSYNFETRDASLSLHSTAPLLHMVQRFAKDSAGPVIAKLRHDDADTLEVKLTGNVKLTQDYKPSDIRVRGGIVQQNLVIGGSRLDRAEISFNFNNGELLLEKCQLDLPGGTISLHATSQGGGGSAEIHALVDVESVLRLVSEFTSEPVALPSGLVLYGKTGLDLQATLRTAVIKTGEFEWADCIPHVSGLQLTAKVDSLDCAGYTVDAPSLQLDLSGVQQDFREIPTGIERADLALTAGSAAIPLGEGKPALKLSGVDLTWQASGIQLLDLLEKVPDIVIQNTHATLRAAHMEHDGLCVDGTELRLEDIDNLHPLDKRTPLPENATLQLLADHISHEGAPLGKLELTSAYSARKPTQAPVTLTVTPHGAAAPLRLTATPDWTLPGTLDVLDIDFSDQNLTVLDPILEHFDAAVVDVRLPDNITLTGNLRYNLRESRVSGGEFTVNIPELVRTPSKVEPLRSKQAAISVDAHTYLFPLTDGRLAYDANAKVYHETGMADARIQGSGAKFTITGTNSIRADIIDILADDPDAHLIIRDFKFTPSTRTKVTDIHVDMDLSGPGRSMRVKSFCQVEVEDFAYMLDVMERLPDGTERVRPKYTHDPYTYLDKGTCSVTVDLAYFCVDAEGNPIPDECTIVIGNAVMEYNNTPWLKRQKFKTGERKTVLTGDKIFLDTEREYVEIHNIRGRVYPAYSIGMFYPDLQDFMEDVILPDPVMLNTIQCVFPYSGDAPVPYSGTISMASPATCHLHMLGTDIPLEDFSGFIHMEKDAVLLDRLNATCWEGVVNAVIRFGFSGKHTTVDGYGTASCLNLRRIAAAYDNEQNDALCHARIRFRSPSMEVDDLEAYGDVQITDGNLLKLGIFSPVSELISDIPGYFSKLEKAASKFVGYSEEGDGLTRVLDGAGKLVGEVGGNLDKWTNKVPFANYVVAYGLKNAQATFTISRGHLTTNDLEATGMNLTINAVFDLNLNTLYLQGNLWPRLYSIPSIVLTPITFLSKYLIDINIRGPVDKLKWAIKLDSRLRGSKPSATSEEKPKR